MRKLLAVTMLVLLATSAAMAQNGIPEFVTNSALHRSVGMVPPVSAIPGAIVFSLEVVVLVTVDGLPQGMHGYGLPTPHMIEVRGYLPDVMPHKLPLLRVLVDEDGDGVSDFAAEVLDYEGDRPILGAKVIVRLPMATTRNFDLPPTSQT